MTERFAETNQRMYRNASAKASLTQEAQEKLETLLHQRRARTEEAYVNDFHFLSPLDVQIQQDKITLFSLRFIFKNVCFMKAACHIWR